MHIQTVEFNLGEASLHLQQLVADLRAGRMDSSSEPELSVQLAQILDHLCLAWNCKDLTPEQRGALSQEEFERLSNTVPNFLGQRVIGEFAFS